MAIAYPALTSLQIGYRADGIMINFQLFVR